MQPIQRFQASGDFILLIDRNSTQTNPTQPNPTTKSCPMNSNVDISVFFPTEGGSGWVEMRQDGIFRIAGQDEETILNKVNN